ncbi:hypothetical protein HYFRA_00013524 [Hymenoscyphus fraxineus]|uniref:Glycoside hydrolase family 105 protein n=1 Tax=Hymenoscyphus fraxineus TaxID=746836 RepID=A0A9N9L8W3_9HELO|nr:hypothetical protein HYFRA_00013524 [Hymenoscyphus fraxineus]
MQFGVLAAGFALTTTVHATAECSVTEKYSLWMAQSLISRNDGIMNESFPSAPLQAGITQKAFTALLAQYPDDDNASIYRDYIRSSVDSVLHYFANGNATADVRLPMDRLSSGNALLDLSVDASNQTAASAYQLGAETLRSSIDVNRRNSVSGLWYYVYPEWSYLDGMYSLAPFYARYTLSRGTKDAEVITAINGTAVDDMMYQLDLLWQRCRNITSGLLVHGYDDSRTAVWANPETGASPNVWGRSLGWYFMALVDTLEILSSEPVTQGYTKQLGERYRSLAAAVIQAVDPQTGAWWQVVDQPGRKGNYIESSASSMFTYGLLKGARLGYLEGNDAESSKTIGVRAYEYLTNTFVVHENERVLGWNGTVTICSLNSTATYEYYVGQPLRYNSILGSAAFILASLEYENVQGSN